MLPPRDLCLILGASGLLRQSTAAPIDSSQPLDTGRLNLARSDATPELDRVRIRSFQDEAAFQDFNRFLASPATGAGLQPGIGRDKISLRAIDHINKFKRSASDQTSGDKSSPAISTLNQNDRRSALGEHHKRHQEQPSPPGDLLTDDSDNKKADPAEHAPPAPQATPEASKNVPKPKTSTDDGKTVTLNAWIEVKESTPKSPSSPPIVSIISSQAPAVQGHDAPKALPSANANPPTVPAGDGHGEPKAAPPPTPVGDGHGEPKAAPPPNPAADGHGEPKAAPPPTPAGDAHGEPKAAPAPTPAGDAHGEPKAAPPPNPAGDGHGEAKAPTPVAPAGDGHGEAKAPTPAAPPADGEGEAPAGDTHGQVKGSTPAPAGDTHGDVKAPAPEAGHDQVKAVQPDQNAKSSPVVPNPTDKSIGPTGTQAHSVSPSDAGPGPGPKPQGAAQKDAGANTAPQAPGNPKPEIKDLSQLTSQINKALADTGITLAIHSDPLKIEMSLTGKTPSNS